MCFYFLKGRGKKISKFKCNFLISQPKWVCGSIWLQYSSIQAVFLYTWLITQCLSYAIFPKSEEKKKRSLIMNGLFSSEKGLVQASAFKRTENNPPLHQISRFRDAFNCPIMVSSATGNYHLKYNLESEKKKSCYILVTLLLFQRDCHLEKASSISNRIAVKII